MPWVDGSKCTGCMTCREQCPAGAIHPVDDIVQIEEERCIRCGQCHDVCPVEAVCHDGERIPADVSRNLEWARSIASNGYFSTPERRKALIERLVKYFVKQQKVAEQTVGRMGSLREELLSESGTARE